MNKIATSMLLAALGLASSPVFASEVMATVAPGKGNTGLALDIVSDGGIAGFSFAIEVPNLDEKSVNLKGCLSDLPQGFKGGCSVAYGKIMVIAAADQPSGALGQGLIKVGKVFFSQSGAKAGEGIQVTGVEFSDNNAKSQPGTAKVQAN
jgi:hypothetical protein